MAAKFVVCVDARRSDGLLRKGEIYPVVAERGEYLDVGVASGPYPGFYKFRFRPAPSIEGLRAFLQSKPVAGLIPA